MLGMSEVPGRGNPHARGLILGEAPGEEEERLGVPFIGPSGRLLSEALREAGIDEEQDVWITNVVKTRPPDNRTPTKIEVEHARSDLGYELDQVEPEAILALGNIPLLALTGAEGGITQLRGCWIPALIVGAGIPVMPTVHPAFVRRDRPKWEDTFRRDVALFAARVVQPDKEERR